MKIKRLFLGSMIVLMTFYWHATVSTQTQHPQKSIELKEVKDYFDSFLNAWLIEQDIEKAKTYIDTNDSFFREIFKDMFKVQNPAFDYDTWLTKTLLMWLEADHGAVSDLSHGDPAHSRYINMPVKLEDLKNRLKWQNLNEAVKEVEVGDFEKSNYMGFMILKHAPRDGLMFFIKKVGNKWSICGYMWIVG